LTNPTKKQRRIKGVHDRFSERGYRPYVSTIGRLILAWNNLHENLGMLFVLLLAARHRASAGDDVEDIDDPVIARWAGIWSSAAYDRPKRAMLSALMNPIIAADFGQLPKLVSDISWLLKETDKIEEIRNNAVHAPLIWVGDHPAILELIRGHLDNDVIPNLILGNKRALLVSRPGMRGGPIKEYRWGRDASLVLRDFAVAIRYAIAAGAPWPDRPQLPNRGDSRGAKYRHQLKRPRPPRSSPA
jgi:hypothetical protein